jgi:hypothetical protein
MTVILFLLFAFSAFAQEFQYRLEGSFVSNATTVNYIVNWNETSTTIQGLYQDNLFAQGGPKILSGTVAPSGRTMNVILPQELLGVRSIILHTPMVGTTSGSVPLNITTQDNLARTVDSPDTFSMMSTLPKTTSPGDEKNEEVCVIGFGVLTGFCGLYNGVFNEISDNRNRCDLLTGGNLRLELTPDTVFTLHFNYALGQAEPTFHTIGAFALSPQTNTVNITGQNCSVLPSTTFIPNNCKTINLNGSFLDQAGIVTFNGTYTIADQVNADSCSYSMSLTREVTY